MISHRSDILDKLRQKKAKIDFCFYLDANNDSTLDIAIYMPRFLKEEMMWLFGIKFADIPYDKFFVFDEDVLSQDFSHKDSRFDNDLRNDINDFLGKIEDGFEDNGYKYKCDDNNYVKPEGSIYIATYWISK